MEMLKTIMLTMKIQSNFNAFLFFLSETHLAWFKVLPFLSELPKKLSKLPSNNYRINVLFFF